MSAYAGRSKKDKKTSSPLVPSHCSPSRYGNKERTLDATGTCLTSEEVVETAKVALGARSLNASRFDARTLVKRVHEALGTSPGEEDKWIDAPSISRRKDLRDKISTAFRPEHPEEWLSDPHYWLSNFDIDAVMRQYQQASPTFRFIGVFPRDFSAPIGRSGGSGGASGASGGYGHPRTSKGPHRASSKGGSVAEGQCVSETLCNLSLAEEVAKGFKEVGFVLNLDTHRGPGTHWTSCYIGLDPINKPERFGFFYYDSVGRQPPKEIREFSKKLAEEARTVFPTQVPFRITHNTVRKQFMDSECGIYSMFWLVAMVQTDIPFEEICRDVIKRDRAMHGLRKVFFRPPDN